ncbi:MAG: SpoVA/SpoVAEb family sporulation membrane protein [Clostridia bacterium]
MMERKEYQKFVKANSPKSPMWRSLTAAFFVGGIICCIGEGVGDILLLIFPEMAEKAVASWTTSIMIFIGSTLTALGLYDKIGHFAGGGSIIPITGFANSVVSPAIEYNREGVFYGICAKMFIIAGPIIVFGVTASFLIGIIGMFI